METYTEKQKETIKGFAEDNCLVKFIGKNSEIISCDFSKTSPRWGRQEFYTPESFFEFFSEKIYPELN